MDLYVPAVPVPAQACCAYGRQRLGSVYTHSSSCQALGRS